VGGPENSGGDFRRGPVREGYDVRNERNRVPKLHETKREADRRKSILKGNGGTTLEKSQEGGPGRSFESIMELGGAQSQRRTGKWALSGKKFGRVKTL